MPVFVDRTKLPAVFMVFGAITSMQLGAAVAISLFDQIGSMGTVFLRSGFAALVLWVLWRPSFKLPPGQLRLVLLFGGSITLVTLTFYAAIDRIPLGTAVTLEFSGPLTVALITSRRRRDIIWAVMAAVGIVLITGGISGHDLDPVGVVLALVAGFFWGCYILIGTRLGGDSSGGSMLSLAMIVSTVFCLLPGVFGAGTGLIDLSVLAVGLVVGLLSAAIPFSLEFESMRRLPSSVFGVMMSLEPAVAALIGFVALKQSVRPIQAAAIALVVSASAGALYSSREPPQVEP